MRALVIAPALLALTVATAGCFTQTSIQPFLTADEGVVVPELAGQWIETEGDHPDILELTPAVSKSPDTWTLRLEEKGDEPPAVLEVRLGRMGDHLVWDMTVPEDKSASTLVAVHRLPLHSLARLSLDGDRLRVAYLDPEWFSTRAKEGALDVAHLVIEEDSLLLTATTDELRDAVLAHWDEAFGDASVFVRRKAQ